MIMIAMKNNLTSSSVYKGYGCAIYFGFEIMPCNIEVTDLTL